MSDKHLAQLRQLPFFTEVSQIDPITTGLSQPSYQVSTDHQHYFAKYVAQQYLSDEIAISQITAKEKLSPRVIYHDKHWLISDFINGTDLREATLTPEEKVSCAVKLMTDFHQLSLPCEPLDVTAIYNGLINAQANSFNSEQLATFQQLLAQIKSHIDVNIELVSCHGDLNFNNILIEQSKRSWLIDFECSCKAPAEFDIAMLIAVNELTLEHVNEVSNQYLARMPQGKLDIQVINYFLLFSYLINGLWYDNKSIAEHEYNEKFATLAKAQWWQLQQLIIKMELPIDNSIFTR